MRLPIILALAVILLTPANIREVLGEARALVTSVLERNSAGDTVEVADATTVKSRHDTAKNAISNVR